ncbi:hypothetical protein MVEN_02605100 [Mycena venus]|uniref:DUF1365-domain-containing protein n=1 Tax=Mycena venus TaxID=2733690 RepID=A0A8H6WU28_9AGAR|nr:hypothetical protein MVEN_02605100 [Mycena venus]
MDATPTYPRGYILENQVIHARLVPVGSTHAFTYPTLSLLLSLNALESHSLDLGWGWIFGYGGRWARLVGLRPAPYLTENGGSIRQRLEKVLLDRGFGGELEDAWMMTMPSLLGFEGINPLTVYFCYRPGGQLFLAVLEVHNTFGESHVYCLELNKGEDKMPARGFDHQWTIPRAFHVSPFNDRRGFYTISIKSPTHSPTGISYPETSLPPRPSIRVHLHTQSDDPVPVPGPLKLTALLRPTSATPLTSRALILALFRAPVRPLLRLDVFIRPEPVPATWVPPNPNSGLDPLRLPVEGGVRWLSEGPFERYARHQVESFLGRRVDETGVSVSLIPADPSLTPLTFSPSVPPTNHEAQQQLTISYLSPRLYTILLISPSAQHALLLGTAEHIFTTSSTELFLSTFAAPSRPPAPSPARHPVPTEAWLSLIIPQRHALDPDPMAASRLDSWISTAVIWTLLFLNRMEPWVFWMARARPVEGTEPWKMWERAAKVHKGEAVEVPRDPSGSVRREN